MKHEQFVNCWTGDWSKGHFDPKEDLMKSTDENHFTSVYFQRLYAVAHTVLAKVGDDHYCSWEECVFHWWLTPRHWISLHWTMDCWYMKKKVMVVVSGDIVYSDTPYLLNLYWTFYRPIEMRALFCCGSTVHASGTVLIRHIFLLHIRFTLGLQRRHQKFKLTTFWEETFTNVNNRILNYLSKFQIDIPKNGSYSCSKLNKSAHNYIATTMFFGKRMPTSPFSHIS